MHELDSQSQESSVLHFGMLDDLDRARVAVGVAVNVDNDRRYHHHHRAFYLHARPANAKMKSKPTLQRVDKLGQITPPVVAFTAGELDEIDKLVDELKKDAYVTRALAERIERLEKIVLHRKLRSKYETKPK
jgi:hypothetical protein